MPIEIREVVIKTTLVQDKTKDIRFEEIQLKMMKLKQEILEECLDIIMEKIDNDLDR